MQTSKVATLLRRLLVVGAICGGACTPSVQAENPPGCDASDLGVKIKVTPSRGYAGDTLAYEVTVDNGPELGNCDQLQVYVEFKDPSDYGTANVTKRFPDMGNLGTFAPGDSTVFPPVNYIVNPADLTDGVLKARAIAYGLTDGEGNPTANDVTQSISAVLLTPQITITKVCRLIPDGNGGFLGEATVTIQNTGNVGLEQVLVIDDAGTPGDPGDDFSPGTLEANPFPTTLAAAGEPGDSAFRVYTFAVSGTSYVNTVNVTAVGEITPSPGNEAAAQVEATDDCALVIPAILIEKTVACVPAGGDCQTAAPYGETATGVKVGATDPSFCYQIRVKNIGGEVLNNVTVSDPLVGPITVPAGGSTLDPNEEFTVYVKKSFGSATLNTATTQGVGATSGLTVTDSDTASVDVVPAALRCEKLVSLDGQNFVPSVEIPINTPTSVTYKVNFINSGAVDLQVTYSDPGCLINNAQVLVPAGQTVGVALCSKEVTCTGTAAVNTVLNEVDWSAQVGGRHASYCARGADGQPLSLSGDCTATVTCKPLPEILIEKSVACVPAGGGCTEGLPYSETATGIKVGSNNPAFCYRIRVKNTGTEVINNVVVNDDKLGPITIPASGSILDPNEEFTVYVSASHAVATANIATVDGVGAVTGIEVTDDDGASVDVKTAALSCTKAVSIDGGQTYQNSINAPFGTPLPVVYKVSFNNTGNVALLVTYSDPSCDVVDETIVVPAGQVEEVIVCRKELTCSGTDIVNTVTWSAEATGITSTVCVYNSNGERITLTGSCSATITCKPEDCISRTIGYWFQHVIPTREGVKCATLTAAFEFILDEDGDGDIGENRIDLGFIKLPTRDYYDPSDTVFKNNKPGLDVEDAVIEALGFFHGKRSTAGDGSRDATCLARKRLALQLIGATANVYFLNQQNDSCGIYDEEASQFYTGQELLEAARQAAINCDLGEMSHIHGLLDEFNNKGDELGFEDYGLDKDNSNDLRPCPVGRQNKTYIGENTYDPTTSANCACPE